MPRSKMLYKLPQGTERLLLEDAFHRQRILRLVQDLFTSWGYLPVQTPVIDFYDLYAPFLDRGDGVYRLVDREGDLLMVRSDITLFLARSVGSVMREGHKPLRLCYADTILRPQDAQDISENEFFQIGAEFIGSASPNGDLEILVLLDEVLSSLGLKDARIHLGSRAVFDALTEGRTDLEKQELQTSVLYRRPSASGLGEDALKLFAFVGDIGRAEALLAELSLPEKARNAAYALLGMGRELLAQGLGDRFRIDFSEIGRWSYYTGLVFQAYHPGVGDAIANGGRYDALLGHFGLDSPSVGFSLSLRKIEPFAGQDRLPEPVAAQGISFGQRLTWARKERAAGRVVVLEGGAS